MAAAALGADELSDSGEGGCRSLLLPAALTTLLFALLLGLLPPRSVPITPIDGPRVTERDGQEVVHKVVGSFPFPARSQVFSLNERVTNRNMKEVPTKGRQLHVTAAHVNVVHIMFVRSLWTAIALLVLVSRVIRSEMNPKPSSPQKTPMPPHHHKTSTAGT